MKYLLRVLVWHSLITLILAGDICQQKWSTNGRWTCERNQNITLITYDCMGKKNATEIYIWSDDFPKDTAALTIQNCASITLDITRNPNNYGQLLPDFKFLHAVNISELKLFTERFVWGYRIPFLPSNVVFENVNFQVLDLPLLHFRDSLGQDCCTSLEFKNTSMKVLRTGSLPLINLDKLIFDELKVGLAEKNVFIAKSNRSVIKITNSFFENVSEKFMDLEASEIIFSGNVVEKSNKREMFSLQAEKVIFTHNTIEKLTGETMKITSRNIQMADNIFQQLDENVFKEIRPLKPNNFSLDFSNNIIYRLNPEPTTAEDGKDIRNLVLADVTIFNNSINCVCENMFWFQSEAWNQGENYFAYKWVRKANRNKCLNIPRCYVSQVFTNYHELCESDYKCPEEPSPDYGKLKGHPKELISEEHLDNSLNLNLTSYNYFVFIIFLICVLIFLVLYLTFATVRIKNYLDTDGIFKKTHEKNFFF